VAFFVRKLSYGLQGVAFIEGKASYLLGMVSCKRRVLGLGAEHPPRTPRNGVPVAKAPVPSDGAAP
jgi:hypothetical protein